VRYARCACESCTTCTVLSTGAAACLLACHPSRRVIRIVSIPQSSSKRSGSYAGGPRLSCHAFPPRRNEGTKGGRSARDDTREQLCARVYLLYRVRGRIEWNLSVCRRHSRRSHSRKQSQVLLSLGASAPRVGRGWGAAAAASRPFLPPLLRARLPCVLLRQNGMVRVAGPDLRKR
jgi:hypothetical protein